MRFTRLDGSNFNVVELVTDADRAKITSGKVIELRIWDRDIMVMYDWDGAGSFKASAVVDDEDTCSHQQAGGAYNTGNWKNNTAINYSVFVAGHTYVFEFYNATDGEIISQREQQWGGQYGDIAQATALTTHDTNITALVGALNNITAVNVVDALKASTGWTRGNTLTFLKSIRLLLAALTMAATDATGVITIDDYDDDTKKYTTERTAAFRTKITEVP
jgi:hypothetical protein